VKGNGIFGTGIKAVKAEQTLRRLPLPSRNRGCGTLACFNTQFAVRAFFKIFFQPQNAESSKDPQKSAQRA